MRSRRWVQKLKTLFNDGVRLCASVQETIIGRANCRASSILQFEQDWWIKTIFWRRVIKILVEYVTLHCSSCCSYLHQEISMHSIGPFLCSYGPKWYACGKTNIIINSAKNNYKKQYENLVDIRANMYSAINCLGRIRCPFVRIVYAHGVGHLECVKQGNAHEMTRSDINTVAMALSAHNE